MCIRDRKQIVIICSISAFLTMLARVHLGAHYLTDCIVGYFLGWLIVYVAHNAFQHPDPTGCTSCFMNKCYNLDPSQTLTKENFHLVNLVVAGKVTIGLLVLFLLVLLPPVKFWEKSAPLMGSYSAIIISNFFLACPRSNEIVTAPYRDLKSFSIQQIGFYLLTSEVNYLCTNWILNVLKTYHTSTAIMKYLLQIFIFFAFFIGTLFYIIAFRVFIVFQRRRF
eukprot:TRINITY_DN11405_c0_g1_i6.p1 TRINITY_DN11405_c0_g1~~TRINITY_DN11405_c0_g1_i6.p1  ORF type:complete len:223 (+),score=29.07 TRINITY_DN11405_c0_g1_i6:64-732(+)